MFDARYDNACERVWRLKSDSKSAVYGNWITAGSKIFQIDNG